jgi:hypothetical protein
MLTIVAQLTREFVIALFFAISFVGNPNLVGHDPDSMTLTRELGEPTGSDNNSIW